MPNKLIMADILPESSHGEAKISHCIVSEKASAFSKIRSIFSGSDDAIEPGKYAQLIVNGTMYMSDTQMEYRTSRRAVLKATGRVLVGGLGLGMVALEMHKPSVLGLWVVEKSPDVIKLVEPHLQAKLPPGWLTVIEGDVFKWKPPKDLKFNYAWLDIWPDLCLDNLAEMTKLRRRFKPFMVKDNDSIGQIDCWGESWLKTRRKRK